MDNGYRRDRLNKAYSIEVTCPFCKGTGTMRVTRDIQSGPEDWAAVIQHEANRLGLLPADLTGASRAQRVTEARHRAMWRLREEYDLAWKQIGCIFGKRNHSTAIHGAQQGRRYIMTDAANE